jgi:hypothetical protein
LGDFEQVIDVWLASGSFSSLVAVLFSGVVGGFKYALDALKISCPGRVFHVLFSHRG